MKPWLEINDLTIAYESGGYAVRPIENLNLSAETGELMLLLGPSGCGKTSLLSCLAGILSPTTGRIRVGSDEVTSLTPRELTLYRRHKVGVVFQSFNLIGSLSALENVAAPLRSAGVSSQTARGRALESLVSVGLEDRTSHRPGDLSGGQQQRVAIARALVLDPPLIVADEPTAHLDHIQAESVLRTLRGLARGGRLIVISTHDDRIVPLADRVVRLTSGAVETAPSITSVVLAEGVMLFNQGERGELIYVVETGEVELSQAHSDGTVDILGRVGPGDYFGELAPLLGFPRAASARAASKCTLRAYTVAAFRAEVGPAKLAELVSRK